MRRHRTAVGVSERDLTLAGPVKYHQHFLAARLALADRGDLLGQVLDPRSRCRRFAGVAGVEPLEIVVESGVSKPDELSQ
jgi:hypothetical protein